MKLLAFHNDKAIKKAYLNRVAAHRAADEIVNGQYWQEGKGCAVGCTIHGDSHAAYETEIGVPRILARLEDRLFEAIYIFDPARAKNWPHLFLDSIREGAELELVWPKFAHWLLVDPADGIIRVAKTKPIEEAIRQVAELYRRWVSGDKPDSKEWLAAAAAASYAYADASDTYASYAAAAATYAAAAASADADDVRNAHYGKMADKLIALLVAA